MIKNSVLMKKMLIFAFSFIIVLSMIFSVTYAVFSAQKVATGTITFNGSVSILMTRANADVTQKIAMTTDYALAGNGAIYGDLQGEYGNLLFPSTGKKSSLNYNISGELAVYLGFEIEMRFTPTNANTYDTNYLKNNTNWNLYPVFDSHFDWQPVQKSGNYNDYSFYCPNAKSICANLDGYGLLVTAPFLSNKTVNGKTVYSKTYRMYLTKMNDSGFVKTCRIYLKDKPLNISFDKIMPEVRYAFSYANGQTAEMMTDGSIEMYFSCKASATPFFDAFVTA